METKPEKVKLINGDIMEIKVKRGLGYLTVANILGKAMKVSAIKGREPEIDLSTLMTEGVKAVIIEPKGFNLDLLNPEDGMRIYKEYVEPFLSIDKGGTKGDKEVRGGNNPQTTRNTGGHPSIPTTQDRTNI